MGVHACLFLLARKCRQISSNRKKKGRSLIDGRDSFSLPLLAAQAVRRFDGKKAGTEAER